MNTKFEAHFSQCEKLTQHNNQILYLERKTNEQHDKNLNQLKSKLVPKMEDSHSHSHEKEELEFKKRSDFLNKEFKKWENISRNQVEFDISLENKREKEVRNLIGEFNQKCSIISKNIMDRRNELKIMKKELMVNLFFFIEKKNLV